MRSFLIYFFLCISASAFSQDLTGEWKGHYTYDQIYSVMPDGASIDLNITRNQDNSFAIVSYTKFKIKEKDTIVVCKVLYKKVGKRTTQLEEKKSKDDETDNQTFQKMFLKFRERKGITELYGRWESANGSNSWKGDIIFTKVN